MPELIIDHFRQIYSSRAADYHRMMLAEDVDGQVLAALRGVAPAAGKRVLDLGSGTGRLPLLLADEAASFVALDLHAAMLREQYTQQRAAGGHWGLVQGDMRQLPFTTSSADVVLAGWAIGHLRGWYADDWKAQIARVLSEMERACEPGGVLVILETLTTGSLTPAPPSPELAEYYAWLENQWGFQRQTIATDYVFESVEAAAAQTEFFFGADLARLIRQNAWARLPEWTGVWSKRVGAPVTASAAPG
jgi:ubiquinone/menaquinone biosynthesis C-methylase UbiE